MQQVKAAKPNFMNMRVGEIFVPFDFDVMISLGILDATLTGLGLPLLRDLWHFKVAE